MSEMTKDDLVKHVNNLSQKIGDDDLLDELVHKAASQVASNVNNRGALGQIEWLIEVGYTPADIWKEATGG